MSFEFVEMTGQQRRMLIDTRQLWQAAEAARNRFKGYAGSMHWQTTKGRDYLVRKLEDPVSRVPRNQSLGPRSSETEDIYEKFMSGRMEAKARLRRVEAQAESQAAINRAIGIGRVPRIAADILRELHTRGHLGTNVQVVGTNALFAYEVGAGVFFDSNLLATEDIDLLFDARAKLNLSVNDIAPEPLLSIIRNVDKSFDRARNQTFRANNANGYIVDFIKPEPRPAWKDEPEVISNQSTDRDDDLIASPIRGLTWLESAPKFETVAVDDRGWPVPMCCPDPRAFAIYKLWLGRKAPNRDPVKRRRDIEQAHAVFLLVSEYMPDRKFSASDMKNFPIELVSLSRDEWSF